MEEIDGLTQEIIANTFAVGTSYWVDITHINDPHSFYVRPRAYNVYMPIVEARGELMSSSEINVGTIVIFKSETMKTYIRGKVIFMKAGNIPMYDLHAIDVGFIERSVSIENIWKPYYQIDLPSLVTHCQLAECAPRASKWVEATNAMKKYVGEESAAIIVRGKTINRVIVEMYNSNMDDIATLLVFTGFSTFGYIPNIS